MKKIAGIISKKALTMLSLLALFVGTTSASTATFFLTQQIECPKELLK